MQLTRRAESWWQSKAVGGLGVIVKAPIHIGRIHLCKKALPIFWLYEVIFGAVLNNNHRVRVVIIGARLQRRPLGIEIAGTRVFAGLQKTVEGHHTG